MYKDCSLPLGKFIDILNTGNVKLLSRWPILIIRKIKLETAWENILAQYSELMDSDDYKVKLDIMQDYGSHYARLYMISAAITVLRYKYDEGCAMALREAGYNYKFNPDDKEQYYKDLDLVEKKAKTLNINVKQLASDLNKLFDKEERFSKAKFLDNVATVSHYMGFKIGMETTLYEYISYTRQLIAHNKSIENAKGRKNK